MPPVTTRSLFVDCTPNSLRIHRNHICRKWQVVITSIPNSDMTRVFVHHGIRIDITCRISYDPGGTYFVRSHCAREPEIWRKKIAFISEKSCFNTEQRICTWKEYFPNLLETALLCQIFVYWDRDFKFWLLAYYFISF